MTFDRFKAFLADDMLDAAGIFRGGLLINTKAHQAAGEELVALIDHLCDRASAVGQFIVAKTPAGRWGDPEDMVGPCVFLASHASDFVNGQILYADGGILAYIGRQPK